MMDTRRPSEEASQGAISNFLEKEFPEVEGITFHMCEDGDETSAPGKCGWAFWVGNEDTTSYVHEDLTIEWCGLSDTTLEELGIE